MAIDRAIAAMQELASTQNLESRWSTLLGEEMATVEGLIVEASHLEFPGLAQILQFVLLHNRPRWLAAASLLSSLPQSNQAEPALTRAKLAAGLEVLQGAITVHDQMVAGVGLLSRGGGANVLLGDTAFSRAAVLVSETNCPGAVAIFSQTLAAISQTRLKRLIEHQVPEAGTAEDLPHLAVLAAPVLYAGACEAGALLAGRSEGQQLIFAAAGEALGQLVQAQPEHEQAPDILQTLTTCLSNLPHGPANQGLLSLAQTIITTGAA